MEDKMLIKGTSVSVTYKRIGEIKKNYYNNEEILKEHFNEATVLPVPEEAPVEIPRIIIKTKNDHGQLNITPIATTFEVVYNDGFERDWNACARYLTERMKSVFEFLNIMTGNKYEYVGLVSNVLYDEVQADGAKKIADVLLNAEKIHEIQDINIKYTFVENNSMYVNITLQNARLFEDDLDFSKARALNRTKQMKESIAAIIDINDRWLYNVEDNYTSSNKKLTELMNSMSDVINGKLGLLIEKGEYGYGK